ncbi:MAG: energy-coupling factor transporter transmembrane protein EcfT [Oscillospiraceae bacterium]|nr:energy-coupling factor transporter transmembrane protein EcfT [Oscillospiraceae bacterium]
MKAFSDYHPVVLAVYFAVTAGITMFSQHPVLAGISLLGAVVLFLVRNGRKQGMSHLFFLLMLAGMALINPLVSHNGSTVLFVMNHNPVTLEALLYGVSAGVTMTAVLYWMRSLSQIMTRDKLLCVCSRLSPGLALVLSMAIRYISLFSAQARKIHLAQKAAGRYGDHSLIDRIRGGMRIFSVLLTWALEHGITTADSMEARGYGSGKRTQFARFRMGSGDGLLLAGTLLTGGLTCGGMAAGALSFSFYPQIVWGEVTPLTAVSLVSFGLLTILPVMIEAKEALAWKYYLSRV